MVKLLAAVWAGEAQRSADDVRRLQGPDKTGPGLLHALGVADAWATGVQDGYIRATLELCRQSVAAETPWVLDTTLSQGWLSADRMASLALIASLQLPGTGGGEPRARLALTLSDSELNGLESSLSSLMAAGRTFASITWAGSSWSVTDPGVCLAVDGCRRGRVPPARMLHGAAASRPCRTKVSQPLSSWPGGFAGGAIPHPRAGRFRPAQIHGVREQDFKSRAKFSVGSTPGRKRELAYPGAEGSLDATDSLPLAHYPWNQVSTLQLSLAGSVAG